MEEEDWWRVFGHSVTLFVNGEGIRELGPQGERRTDTSFLLLFNAHWEPVEFTLPGPEFGQKWTTVLETYDEGPREPRVAEAGETLLVRERSLVVLDRTI
jgi:glycogen operon protein